MTLKTDQKLEGAFGHEGLIFFLSASQPSVSATLSYTGVNRKSGENQRGALHMSRSAFPQPNPKWLGETFPASFSR